MIKNDYHRKFNLYDLIMECYPLLKLLVLSFGICSLSCVANELQLDVNAFHLPLKQNTTVNNTSASFMFNEYVQENYGKNGSFSCGTVSNLTPDQVLKFAYQNGKVEIVNNFSYTKPIETYTPIRQIVLNSNRSAVFKGYYFVSQ